MNALKFKFHGHESTVELYRMLLDHFSIVAVTDNKGVIVDANNKFFEMAM